MADPKQVDPFPVTDFFHIAALEDTTSYLIDELLAEGDCCIVGGRKKCLKTSTIIDLLLSLSYGIPFLGRFKVNRKVKCLFLHGEEAVQRIREKIRRIARSKGLKLTGGRIDFCGQLPNLASPTSIDGLKKLIETGKYEVVALDPAYKCIPASIGVQGSNLFVMAEPLFRLSDLAADTGTTVLLAHHLSRGSKNPHDSYQPPDLDDLAFAGFPEWARQWLLLSRRGPYEPGDVHRLWLNAGGSAGHSGLYGLDVDERPKTPQAMRSWGPTILTIDELRAEKNKRKEAQELKKAKTQEEHDQKVKDAMEGQISVSPHFVRERTGLNGPNAAASIARLLTSETIEPAPDSTEQRPKYRLRSAKT